MINMLKTIEPKSDQMNYDDFFAGTKTITITDVKETGNEQQPIAIYYQGCDGKPWKPCKSMRRVIIRVWDDVAANYIGKSITLFGDRHVTWGGQEVGGIRISHMSHIDKDVLVPLSASKTKRLLYRISPLRVDMDNTGPSDEEARQDNYPKIYEHAKDQAHQGTDAYKAHFASLSPQHKKCLNDSGDHEKLKQIAEKADESALVNENQNDIGDVDDPFGEFYGDDPQQQEDEHV